jgi:thiamine-phosphate pyrophosphorylase
LTSTAPDLGLYVILDPEHTAGRDPLWVAAQALAGGATCLQWRAKALADRARWEVAARLRDLTAAASAGLVINDRVDIALAVGADGVHVGPGDLPVAVARHLLGPGPWLGASTPTLADAVAAWREGATYLGVGALYEARAVKPEASAPRGPGWVAQVAQVTPLPIVGIGGIEGPHVAQVIAAGAQGVAVVRAVCAAPDPRAAAAALRALVDAAHARAHPLPVVPAAPPPDVAR